MHNEPTALRGEDDIVSEQKWIVIHDKADRKAQKWGKIVECIDTPNCECEYSSE